MAIQVCTQYTTVGRLIYRIPYEINFSQSVGCDSIPLIARKIDINPSTYRRLSYTIPTNEFIFFVGIILNGALGIGHWALGIRVISSPASPAPPAPSSP